MTSLSEDFLVSRLFYYFEGLEYFCLKKKSRSQILWSEKRVKISLESFGLKEVSICVSNYLFSNNFCLKKSLSLGHKYVGLGKKSQYQSQKCWYLIKVSVSKIWCKEKVPASVSKSLVSSLSGQEAAADLMQHTTCNYTCLVSNLQL